MKAITEVPTPTNICIEIKTFRIGKLLHMSCLGTVESHLKCNALLLHLRKKLNLFYKITNISHIATCGLITGS